MRKISAVSVALVLASIVLMLVSCDPVSSVDYKIYNKTSDTVTVVMHQEILSSAYGGYAIEQGDSVTHYSEADSISVAVLAPDHVLIVHDEWDGLYREEQMVPYWKYIRAIMVGDHELPASSWDNEQAWHLNTDGGKRFEGESRHYILTLRDK